MAVFYTFLTVFVILSVILCARGKSTTKPNIIFIVADDLGWDDVSFHGSGETLTPNIDALAYTGVALGRHYSHCVCTPSRAALLTGKYAHTTGNLKDSSFKELIIKLEWKDEDAHEKYFINQHKNIVHTHTICAPLPKGLSRASGMHGWPLTNGEDRGLPLSEKLLPEYLKDLGYATHLVGKWHLGMSRTKYLPTSRGFDSHFGYRGGVVDYYEYVNEETWSIGKAAGFDLYRNLTPAWDVEGYMTDILTNEAKTIIKNHDKLRPLFLMLSHLAPHSATDGALLQAPPETVRSMRHVESPERRIFTAMMKKLDDSVGELVNVLSENGVLENTIILFISDNGGMPEGNHVNYASNWPLRGSKFTAFEGGIRTTALLWSPALMSTNHLWNGYMHIVDWLPTLLGAIGADLPTKIDGLNLWNAIASNKPSQRHEFFEIYTYGDKSFSSVTSGNYKLVAGNITKEYSRYLGGDLRGLIDGGPSYVEAIKNSDVYSVLQKMGKSFKFEDISLRNRIRIDCDYKQNDEELCFTHNGDFCLFNIKDDPCESRDLSKLYPEVATRLIARLQVEMTRKIDRFPLYRDPRALPRLHNYTWVPWADDIEKYECTLNSEGEQGIIEQN